MTNKLFASLVSGWNILRPRPRVSGYFWKRILFHPFRVSVHTEMAFSVTENESFRKRSPEWIFLKMPFLCCHVDGSKRSFSKTLTSRHQFTMYQSMRTDLWGQQKGILIVCFLLSKFEQRSLNVAASSCGWGYFGKCPSCGRESFWKRIKKDAVSKISGYVWTGPQGSRYNIS